MMIYILEFFFLLVIVAMSNLLRDCWTVVGILTLEGTDLVSLTSPMTPIQ
ncbi:unnamed protein product [Staurois parvus]|uniref:NADH dehydrogenase subunit 1 n=1 Tax=Staurois parvus TaxID=386267 RepID=A0ABN9CMM0_9NEOB|nr:unnamed protein product [Staurois parvus]